MRDKTFLRTLLVWAALVTLVSFPLDLRAAESESRLVPLDYNNPAIKSVDLAAGLWGFPVPTDVDGDGDFELIISAPDVPYNGTYIFENPGSTAGMDKNFPIFKPGVRISRGEHNVIPSYVGDEVRVLLHGSEIVDFTKTGLDKKVKLPVPWNVHNNRVRANEWRYADYDADGNLDLIIGVGDWTEYGWDNAFDEKGNWTRGPLHGYVYLLRNKGTNDKPDYDKAVKLTYVDGGTEHPIDVYGMPSPNLADFDGDGDLDLVCGEFRDTFTYFENQGTRAKPKFAAGRLLTIDGKPIKIDLCMLVIVAFDWNQDGNMDLIFGEEDGRMALLEHTGKLTADRCPAFKPMRYFQQEPDELKFGALITPYGCDFDGDGDDDLVCGNSAGYIGWFENLGSVPGKATPKFAPLKFLEVDGKPLRIMAGPNGSIQGPCEAKWGYTTQTVEDWDGDGLPDLLVNSIWGKIVWYRNLGPRDNPTFAEAEPVQVAWKGEPPKPAWNWWNPKPGELVTQWRTTPVAYDLNRDGLMDLVMLDHEGYLCFFEREKQGDKLVLLPPVKLFVDKDGNPLRLNSGKAGGSGRRKLCLADYNCDGRVDLLANSKNVDFWENVGTDEEGRIKLVKRGQVDPRPLAGHTTSPTVVDWNKDGKPELLIGAEDGRIYRLQEKP